MPTQAPSLTDEDLDEIQERVDRATPGPWVVGDHASEVEAPCRCCGPIAKCILYGAESGDREFDAKYHYNSEFISHARQDVPALLAEVRRLRALLQEREAG
jgi:hypothetical protein